MYTTPDLVRAQPETSVKNKLTTSTQFVFRRHRYDMTFNPEAIDQFCRR